MFTMTRKNILLASSFSIMSAFVVPSWAAFSWTFTGSGAACPSGECVESSNFNGDVVTATATGWTTSSSSIGSSLTNANSLREWDGLSVQSTSGETGTPQHATDNNGYYESVLFAFSQDIVLTDITMGWHYDADFSLLRYAGAGTPTLSGDTYSGLTSSGSWELIDNYLYSGCGSSCSNTDIDVSSDYDTAPLNPSSKSSSYWLVAALNGAYFGNSGYIGNDYFKIKNIAGSCANNNCDKPNTPGSVSEPATWAIMSLGIAGFGFVRLRNGRQG